MRRLIDEYGLAILYAIVGAICLLIFGYIFLGDNSFNKVVNEVVDKSTNNNVNMTYEIKYDLNGGYYEIKKQQAENITLTFSDTTICNGDACKISKLSDITGFVEESTCEDEDLIKYKGSLIDGSGARYYLLSNGEKLWISYTRDKSFALPRPSHNVDETGKTMFFDGWTSQSLETRTRNVVIPKGSTGSKTYTANWTRGKYRIVYNNGLDELLSNASNSSQYKQATDAGFDISALMSGSVADQLVEIGTPRVSIQGNNYTFLGHTFMYWQDDSGNRYYPSSSFTGNDSVNSQAPGTISEENLVSKNVFRLYAVWDLNTYTITYTNWKGQVIMTSPTEETMGEYETIKQSFRSYTILDDFDLDQATVEGFDPGEWYTVNPYLTDNPNDKKFGTYSFKGPYTSGYFFGIQNKIDMAKNGWTEVTANVYNKNEGWSNGGVTAEYKSQHVSRGTYGDIELFSYFVNPSLYTINLYEKHLVYEKVDNNSLSASWKENETEKVLLGKITFLYDGTVSDILSFTTTTENGNIYAPKAEASYKNDIVTEDNKLWFEPEIVNATTFNDLIKFINNGKDLEYQKGFHIAGIEDEHGNLVFRIKPYNNVNDEYGFMFAPASEQGLYWSNYSSVETLNNSEPGNVTQVVTNRSHWAYPHDVDLYIRWEPDQYLIQLHSNY